MELRLVDWSKPPVVAAAFDADGRQTDDLSTAVEGEIIFTLLDGTTEAISWARALELSQGRVSA